MLLEGRSRWVRYNQWNDSYEAGIEFRELQASMQGRQMLTELTRILAGLQLKEARKRK